MSFEFNPFTANLDYYKEHFTVVNHNVDTVLGYGDLLKIHVMDVSGGNRIFTLPDTATAFIGHWIKLVRDGTANWLRVQAGAADRVWNSSVGGYIDCLDSLGVVDTHDYNSVNLVMVAVGQWTTPEFGIWSAY